MAGFIKKIVKVAKYTGIGLLGIVAVYGVGAVVLSVIPVGTRSTPEPGDIEAYVLSNGVHTDIVVPVRTSQIDWSATINYADTPAADTTRRYIGFGWGDKGFYLETPTWAELKPSTAFRAMFWLGSAAMHTTFHHQPVEGPHCVKIYLSAVEYSRLVGFIQKSFKLNAQGQVQHISGHSYGRYDSFYEAHRVYNLFYTCNTWANEALKISGQKASLWTPADGGIFWHYR
ncbi:TIGR02117 family protein [Hymenobacter tibetensis]|uniref:TIGR02117 family protein n=1 Tax=Hymenobacter tibetensis TaxID=497967 RepID=A0ABY4D2T8_9BACT|nr:TIGR02117 family protein [Hymenobacter tibetensis]UOG76347.1 TIGR02117 family protein [Hymenobacter tibetensis]